MSWSLIEFPLIVFALTFVVLWLSAETGLFLRRRHDPGRNERQDLIVVLTATLTLLGLVIGFSFSMAVTRYDQRKTPAEVPGCWQPNRGGAMIAEAATPPFACLVKERLLERL